MIEPRRVKVGLKCTWPGRKHRWEGVGIDEGYERVGNKRPRAFYVTFGCKHCGATVTQKVEPISADAELTIEPK